MTFPGLIAKILSFESRELGDGATGEEIAAAERSLGVRISGGYRQFLQRFGWASLAHLELYGLGGNVPPHLDLVRVTQSERREAELHLRHELVPVMNDGAGNLYCIDTTAEPEPSIVFWDHAAGCDQVPDVEAESFVQWLAQELDDL